MRKKSVLYIPLLVMFFITFSACTPNDKYYFRFDGVWFAAEPYISLTCEYHQGVFIIDEKRYELQTGHANNGVYIKLYDMNSFLPDGSVDSDSYLWKADTKVKNNKLYLTVTEDRISDYEGKTIVLDFYTYEEWEEKQKTE